MLLKKSLFIRKMLNQINELEHDLDRRRRLDGRLQRATLNIFASMLPEVVNYDLYTKNNRISQTYINKNIKGIGKNIHLFNNNTSYLYIPTDQERQFQSVVIVVIKATFQGVIKCNINDIINERLTLKKIMELLENGKAKQLKGLESVLFN